MITCYNLYCRDIIIFVFLKVTSFARTIIWWKAAWRKPAILK